MTYLRHCYSSNPEAEHLIFIPIRKKSYLFVVCIISIAFEINFQLLFFQLELLIRRFALKERRKIVTDIVRLFCLNGARNKVDIFAKLPTSHFERTIDLPHYSQICRFEMMNKTLQARKRKLNLTQLVLRLDNNIIKISVVWCVGIGVK